MSLNHKRRIFRSSFPLAHWLAGHARTGAGVAALAVAGGAALWIWDLPPMPAFPSFVERPAAAGEPAERMVADASRVAVVDGNTLRLADRVVRLDGVIPPARGETCLARDGSTFDCGVAAANALAAMLRQGSVDCTVLGADRNGRPKAMCSAGGALLNHAVVAQGWARAGDNTLLPAERAARAERLGLWAMSMRN